jgi:Outer membrane protein and related peptidoglycan-associated (lipo)proteins
MKKFYASLVILTGSFAAFGQYSDSLVIAEGRIINAATREPVEARIQYQSLPYGNRIGTLNNSKYSFPMFDNEKYAIMVEAEGFLPAKYMLDPSEANDSGKVIMNIELTAGNRATHAAGQVLRLNNLIFQMGKSKISPESFGELEVVLKMMKDNSKMVIQLEGHTDYLGNARENMKLSKDRVDAVKKFLTSRGISSSRIKTKAFGGTMPLSRDETPEGHSLNRRVELRILSN